MFAPEWLTHGFALDDRNGDNCCRYFGRHPLAQSQNGSGRIVGFGLWNVTAASAALVVPVCCEPDVAIVPASRQGEN